MANWVEIAATALVSSGITASLTYFVAAARVTREELAKRRVDRREELWRLVGSWIARAEKARHGMDVYAPEGETWCIYQSYRECAKILAIARGLKRAEYRAVRRFCRHYFGPSVFDLASRIPPEGEDEVPPERKAWRDRTWEGAARPLESAMLVSAMYGHEKDGPHSVTVGPGVHFLHGLSVLIDHESWRPSTDDDSAERHSAERVQLRSSVTESARIALTSLNEIQYITLKSRIAWALTAHLRRAQH